MYLDAMTAIQDHLVQKTQTGGYTYTSELQPERHENGEMCASTPLSRSIAIASTPIDLGVSYQNKITSPVSLQVHSC